MRIAVAGATGVIGRSLVPRLAAAGHGTLGLSRAEGVDILDAAAVRAALEGFAPEVVVHVAMPRVVGRLAAGERGVL